MKSKGKLVFKQQILETIASCVFPLNSLETPLVRCREYESRYGRKDSVRSDFLWSCTNFIKFHLVVIEKSVEV